MIEDRPIEEMEGPQKIEYKPSRKEILKEYEISIRFLDRGCIVTVGCKSIAFEDTVTAMNAINNYVENPYESQKEWRKIIG